ncbi:MAG: creatininase family protein [Gemmatimonadetes bacterium]|nr:creatininase family protein [Gemmatimonadota bacterium]
MADELIRWWSALTTEEVAKLAKRDPVAVLPLGSTEQHGPHLPLSTDLDIALGLLATAFRTIGDVPALAMPPQAVGSSREHARFPGTLSLEPDLLANLIDEIGAALAACGIRRLVLANAHGGNRHALDAAGLRLRDEHDMLVVKASWFRFPRPEGVDLPESEWRHGLHGGAVETAMMLHLRPDLVRRERAAAARSLGEELEGKLGRLGPDGEASFSWLAGDLHASGVVGDARRADPDMGARLVEHYGAVLAQVIRDARAFPLDRLG